jgi:hypothetical protein
MEIIVVNYLILLIQVKFIEKIGRTPKIMKVVYKFKLEISLCWQTHCTSCSWQLAKISGFLVLC